MKLLFLDIDGVLNHRSFLSSAFSKHNGDEQINHLDPDAIEHLNRIVDQTSCLVVLSSAWRMFGLSRVHRWLIDRGYRHRLDRQTPMKISGVRGQEIDLYLKSLSEQPESFCILDDSRDIYPHEENWVWCDPNEGLTAAKADEAIRMLKSVG